MTIYFGSDHRGFGMKEKLVALARDWGYTVTDLGNTAYDETDDYPDFAAVVAKKVSEDPENSRGVVLCGSGAGVNIVANKYPGVRSVTGVSSLQMYAARRDDDVNVLSIAASFIEEDIAKEILKSFFETEFSGAERHLRRIKKISDIEAKNFKSVS